jgi:hypothetical protein
MIRLRGKRKTLKQIAKTLEIGVTTVRMNLIEAGAYTPLRRQYAEYTEEEDELLLQGRKEGLTGQTLTAQLPGRNHKSTLNRLYVLLRKEKGKEAQ